MVQEKLARYKKALVHNQALTYINVQQLTDRGNLCH
jgi:hypothetical protein